MYATTFSGWMNRAVVLSDGASNQALETILTAEFRLANRPTLMTLLVRAVQSLVGRVAPEKPVTVSTVLPFSGSTVKSGSSGYENILPTAANTQGRARVD